MEDKVLETVVNGITWNMLKDVLVKPLAPIMVTKEFTEQIPNGKVDENGFNEYDTQTETKEVESDWATGIVLKSLLILLTHNLRLEILLLIIRSLQCILIQ